MTIKHRCNVKGNCYFIIIKLPVITKFAQMHHEIEFHRDYIAHTQERLIIFTLVERIPSIMTNITYHSLVQC